MNSIGGLMTLTNNGGAVALQGFYRLYWRQTEGIIW